MPKLPEIGSGDNVKSLDMDERQAAQAGHGASAGRAPHWSDHLYALGPRSDSVNVRMNKAAQTNPSGRLTPQCVGGEDSIKGSPTATGTLSGDFLDHYRSLEGENEILKTRLKEIELLCARFSDEISTLKAENEELRKVRGSSSSEQMTFEPTDVTNQVYFTDEEKLARETDWIMKKKRPSKKKEKRNPLRKQLNQILEEKISEIQKNGLDHKIYNRHPST